MDWLSDTFQMPIIFGRVMKTVALGSTQTPIDIEWISENATDEHMAPDGIFSFDVTPKPKSVQVVANNYDYSNTIKFDTSFTNTNYIPISEYGINDGYTWRRDVTRYAQHPCIGKKGVWHTCNRWLNINQEVGQWIFSGSVPTDKSSIADTGVTYLFKYRIYPSKNTP